MLLVCSGQTLDWNCTDKGTTAIEPSQLTWHLLTQVVTPPTRDMHLLRVVITPTGPSPASSYRAISSSSSPIRCSWCVPCGMCMQCPGQQSLLSLGSSALAECTQGKPCSPPLALHCSHSDSADSTGPPQTHNTLNPFSNRPRSPPTPTGNSPPRAASPTPHPLAQPCRGTTATGAARSRSRRPAQTVKRSLEGLSRTGSRPSPPPWPKATRRALKAQVPAGPSSLHACSCHARMQASLGSELALHGRLHA